MYCRSRRLRYGGPRSHSTCGFLLVGSQTDWNIGTSEPRTRVPEPAPTSGFQNPPHRRPPTDPHQVPARTVSLTYSRINHRQRGQTQPNNGPAMACLVPERNLSTAMMEGVMSAPPTLLVARTIPPRRRLGSGFRVLGSGFWLPHGFQNPGSGFWVLKLTLGFWVLGSGF